MYFQSLSDSDEFASTILMLKLFENRFINTTNKLAVSIEDIKRGRLAGEDKGRDGGGGRGGGGAGMANDFMSVLTEQHNSLLLVLAAQTQKLDNLEQVCLYRTRPDEKRDCSAWSLSGETARSEFAPKIEEILQTVEDLKKRLADAEAEVLDLQDDLEEEKSRVEELQGKLRSAQQAFDARARDRRSLGNELKVKRFQAHLNTLIQQPFSAKATDGMSEGTPAALHMQADSSKLVQRSNNTGERGRGRDTERRVSSSRARSSLRPQCDITDPSRSDLRNATFPMADGGGGGRFARHSRYQPVASVQTGIPE